MVQYHTKPCDTPLALSAFQIFHNTSFFGVPKPPRQDTVYVLTLVISLYIWYSMVPYHIEYGNTIKPFFLLTVK